MSARSRAARASRQYPGFNDFMARVAADQAAHILLHAIVSAQTQQAELEKRGLNPTMVADCVDERGRPLREPVDGIDNKNRVIVITRKSPFGPPVWFYASRVEGLEMMLRPARAAFDAAMATLPQPSATTRAAQGALDRAMRDAAALDNAGAPRHA